MVVINIVAMYLDVFGIECPGIYKNKKNLVIESDELSANVPENSLK